MINVFLYKNESDDSYVIFYNEESIPDRLKNDVISAAIPENNGLNCFLKKDESTGLFYWEEIKTEEPTPEPVPPVETIEGKINNLFNMTEQNNLITVDAVLGVYEEILALREEVATLKEITNNA